VNLRTKLSIDHYLGTLLAWLLNGLARVIARVWRRDHSLRTPPRAVLFMKFMGLGSIARAAFLLEAARQRFPHARIGFACFPSCAGLVRLYPQVDDVIVVRDDGLFALARGTVRLVLWAWRNRADLVIDLEVHSKYSSICSALTLARDRAGFAGLTSRFRRGLYTHLVFWNPIRPVDLAYRQLGRALGLRPRLRRVKPSVTAAGKNEVRGLLATLGIPEGARLLGVNPNASELRLERRWPGANFARVITALPPADGLHVLLLGSRAERDYVAQVCALVTGNANPVHNVAGRLTFEGYVALLARLDLLLTNDSGPLHIAAALRVPTVSLWGPCHPRHYILRGAQHVHFYRPIYCSPCIHTTDVPPCGGDNQCMQRLDWRPVARAVCSLLGLPMPPAPRVQRVAASELANHLPVFGYWQRESAASALRGVPR